MVGESVLTRKDIAEVQGLRSVLRSGPILRGVPTHLAQTVYSHTQDAAKAGFIYDVHVHDVLVAHDVTELITGDLFPLHISAKEKDALERLAVKQIRSPRLRALWHEYQNAKNPCYATAAASIAFNLDKLDYVIHCIELEQDLRLRALGIRVRTEDVYGNIEEKLRGAPFNRIFDSVMAMRENKEENIREKYFDLLRADAATLQLPAAYPSLTHSSPSQYSLQ